VKDKNGVGLLMIVSALLYYVVHLNNYCFVVTEVPKNAAVVRYVNDVAEGEATIDELPRLCRSRVRI
jgi:hypothetical protein